MRYKKCEKEVETLRKIVINVDKLTNQFVVKAHWNIDYTNKISSKSFKTWEGAKQYVNSLATKVIL